MLDLLLTLLALLPLAPTEGLAEREPATHALVGATVHVAPGEVIEDATLVVRDGTVVAVGPDVAVPPEARVHDVAGRIIYAGFIEPYSEVKLGDLAPGGYWNDQVTPHADAADAVKANEKQDKALRAAGVVARLAAPEGRVLKGAGVLVDTADASTLKRAATQHARLTPASRRRGQYPTSPMGAFALVRQAMHDADWYERANAAVDADPSLPRPAATAALAALAEARAAGTPVYVDAPDELYALRAARIAEEFSLPVVIRGGGRSYQLLDEVAATGLPVVAPLKFPRAPDVSTPEQVNDTSLRELMHWDLGPENPGRLARADVRLMLTGHGMKRKDYLPKLREAVRRGLDPADALAAVTTTPAEVLGVEATHGTIAPGKAASFVVATGDLFEDDEAEVAQTWVGGRRFAVEPDRTLDADGTWAVTLGDEAYTLELNGKRGTLTPKTDATTQPAGSAVKNVETLGDGVSFTAPRPDGGVMVVAFTAAGDGALGSAVLPDGSRVPVTATKTADAPATRPAADDAVEAAPPADEPDVPTPLDEGTDEVVDEQPPEGEPVELEVHPATRPADDPGATGHGGSFEVVYPLGTYGRETLPEAPGEFVIRGATVWVCNAPRFPGDDPRVLKDAAVLVRAGGIVSVGDVPARDGLVEVDGAGMHLTPGLIDAHSHIATDGGVNEAGQAVTCEVSIGDYIDPTSIHLYRQLAGGVTTANVLHGSANPIGGRNAVISFRWGDGPDGLRFPDAPRGVKFALGENVKQSNWGSDYTTRYPQTRMGVEQILRDALRRGVEYRRQQQAGVQDDGLPVRYDIESAVLAEIAANERWVHCHSYRQDEILALLRVLESFDVTVGSLQHILEGYKVAPEMRAHGRGGATASTFSDWWAFKFEVYDAIPYNGAMMHDAGIVTSFNSDDPELARRLNTEAAKAAKYGGLSPAAALNFVTLNPAIQLRIDDRAGSIEAGKRADLVLWDGPPLSTRSRVVRTYVGGAAYYDAEEDARLRDRDAARKATLVQKVLGGDSPTAATAAPGENDRESAKWATHDAYCFGHDHEGHDHAED